MSLSAYPCPCCGYLIFDEPPGSYAICPICFWEDDAGQLAHPDAGGANTVSLRLAQRNYRECGACEARFAHLVRTPVAADAKASGWHRLDSPPPAVCGLHSDWPPALWALYYWLG